MAGKSGRRGQMAEMKKNERKARKEARKLIDYPQAESCPYEPNKITTLVIGEKQYSIPQDLVPNHPLWAGSYGQDQQIRVELNDLDEDIGHTVVHFLYTGKYETLRQPRSYPSLGVEYRRSVLAYHAARRYSLSGLEVLAKHYITTFSASQSIFQILGAARTIFTKLPADDNWFCEYLYTQLLAVFQGDDTLFEQTDFYNVVGEDHVFLKQVMRTISRVYSTVSRDLKLAVQRETSVPEEPNVLEEPSPPEEPSVPEEPSAPEEPSVPPETCDPEAPTQASPEPTPGDLLTVETDSHTPPGDSLGGCEIESLAPSDESDGVVMLTDEDLESPAPEAEERQPLNYSLWGIS